MTPEWAIREAQPADINFIYAGWTNCIKQGSKLGKICKSSLFYSGFYKYIDDLLMNLAEGVSIHVACKKDEEDIIFGFVVSDVRKMLHFIYVKESFRKIGIGKSLYKAAGSPFYYNIYTKDVEPILESYPCFIYKPLKPRLTFIQEEDPKDANHQRPTIESVS